MVVPEGWEIVELISLSDGGMQNGLFYNNDRKFRGIPIINVGDLYNKVPIVSKRLALFNATHTEIKSFAVNDGDLFFTRSSVVPDGIAFCNWYKQTSKTPVVFDSHIVRFRTNKNKVLPMFLYLQCISRYARMFFLSNAKTAAMTTIDQTVIGKCSILLPPLPEQLRIAEVLSDTDLYITTLERLIAKKEAVKQGVMQELLTGKRRLPGFKDEWVEKRLRDLLQYEQPQPYIVSHTEYLKNGIPVLTAGKSFILGYTAEKIGIYTNIPVIIFDDFTTESKLVNFQFKVKSSAIKFLYSTGLCDIRIIFALMQMIDFPLKDHQRYWISEFSKLVVKIPPTLAEQTAIAEILSDMDAELSALKKKLEKIRLIKQGMMDALLTGKIRLPEDKPNVQFTQRKEQEEISYAAEKTEGYTADHKKRNKHIDDAVMIAGIVNELYSQKYPLGRKKVQKCLYLLRRYQKRSTIEFKKKAAGPYADEIRYRGGEPIALRAQYIITKNGTKGMLFFKGSNIQQALNYIEQWNMQADIQWLRETLKFKSVDTLELWATVDMAICDLENMHMPISLGSIKHLIATNEEWKKKLEKPLFNDDNIIKAISELRTLLEYKSK